MDRGKTLKIIESLLGELYQLLEEINKKKGIILYLLFCFALYSLWSLITPLNGSPDEYMRWDLLKYMTEHWALPRGDNHLIRNETWGFSYAFLPYIPQIVGAFFVRIVRYFTLSQYAILYAARLPSVISAVGTVFFTYKTGQKLFNGKAIWFLTILVSMWPEFAMIASYINNDSFALFTISIITYSWICGIQNNWNWKTCIMLSVGTGLCLLSYYNAFGFILLSVIFWIWSVFSKKKNMTTIRSFLQKATFMFAIMFIIAGWWYIRNAYIYNGDFLGLKSIETEKEIYAREDLKPSNRQTYLNQGKSIILMLRETPWTTTSFKSFIAVFGYMNIYVNKVIYDFYIILMFLGIIGVMAGTIERTHYRRVSINNDLFYKFIICSIPIPIFLSIYSSYSNGYQAQGRYLLPMFISLCILITSGFNNIKKILIKTEKSGYFVFILFALFFLMHILCFCTVYMNYHPYI